MTKDDALIRSHDDSARVDLEDDAATGGFEPDMVENLPQLQVPDLPEDATSIPPEVMANLPVLTETATPEEQAQGQDFESVSDTQELPVQSESWAEVCQMRISNLTGEIQSLNERLDRFEKRIKG
jgi:hypothetical protein